MVIFFKFSFSLLATCLMLLIVCSLLIISVSPRINIHSFSVRYEYKQYLHVILFFVTGDSCRTPEMWIVSLVLFSNNYK